ncbi:alpha/beta hydrolase family protein [Rubritalea tangerina]|uniref:Alpha/beta hydrolase family protein n=1 Tax=Rubritalea tangerina TaxID=430798 RepID=A0ABW4Z9S1_9BACT
MEIRNRLGEKIDHAFHETGRDDVLVVLGHGVTGDKDRDLIVELTDRLVAAGWPCLRISYSGCGASEGSFEEMCISKEVDDLHAVLDQVKGSKSIAYIGHSMGGAVGALAAAKDDRIKVLVSLAGMVHTKTFCETEFGDQVPGEGCMWEDETHPLSQRYVDDLTQIGNTLTAARDVRSPWLLIHGDQDDVVLPKDSEDLYLTLRGKKEHVVLDGADHCFEGDYDRVAQAVIPWLEKHLK